MKFKTEKLNFKKKSINEVKKKSDNFYKLIKERRSVRDFESQIIDIKNLKLSKKIYETSIDNLLTNRPKNMLMDVSKFENTYFKLPDLRKEMLNEFKI